MTTCEKCRRYVVDGHECDGDACSTCVIFGCGRPPAERRLTEVDGTGRTATLAYCEKHA